MHFGPPIDWIWTSAHFDSDLVKTLETWTLQYVLLQPVLAVVHIGLHGFLHHRPLLGAVVSYSSTAISAVSTTLSLSALIGVSEAGLFAFLFFFTP